MPMCATAYARANVGSGTMRAQPVGRRSSGSGANLPGGEGAQPQTKDVHSQAEFRHPEL